MRNQRLRVMAEVALSMVLAAVLSAWKITLPWNIAGGSISLSMLPIFVIALRRGVLTGVLAGALFGVLDYFIEPFFVHPVQVFLDYSFAFAACGLAGIGAPMVRRVLGRRGMAAAGALTIPWAVVGGLGRFAAHFASGVVFFAANAPKDQPVWLYSALYNASYLAPSLVACAVLTAILVPTLEQAVPTTQASS